MTSKKVKKLIVSLIKDDLVNRKLLIGLNDLGLRPTNYYLNLGDTIFSLMGFTDNRKSEKVFEQYIDLTEKAKYLNLTESPLQLDNLADEIYNELSLQISNSKK